LKITRIETLRLDEFPNILWVEVHTDAGLVGLGETFFGARAAEAAIHETVAPQVLGQDALAIERHSRRLLQNYVGFNSTGAEIRAASAFDIALWDIFGQAANVPVYQLLGGKGRDDLRTYNTCAGYKYVRAKPIQRTENWGLGGNDGPYEDLDGFLNHADDLAESLIAEGYTSKAKLGIIGGSAGGITVGRFMTERPDLAAVVFDQVGSSNQLRAEFSPNGPANIPEFGSVLSETGFKALYAMDAYQHVKDGVAYPSVFLTTGLNDPRVASWEPTKMAAASRRRHHRRTR